MEILDTVIQLKQSGMNDDQIASMLQSQGISQRDISDAINQAQIKSAIGQSEQIQSHEVNIPSPEMQQQYQQPTQDYSQQQYQQQPQQYQDSYPNYYQNQATGGDYQGQDYYQQPSYDTETITEIAEQVVAEKFKEFNKKNGDIALFKTSIQDKVDDIDSRLKRIEATIDKLQQAIIQKIGEFGENTNAIKRDVAGLHDVTSKLMNPLIDNYRELQKLNKK